MKKEGARGVLFSLPAMLALAVTLAGFSPLSLPAGWSAVKNFFCAPALAGEIQRMEFHQKKLQNGLRVFVAEDHSSPLVGVAVYYNVGSRDEKPGKTGFAHLFEHMMFQGSKHVGKAEHFRYVARAGGKMNGTTSEDRTNYFETLPSNQLELALWLESDRMMSLNISAENFENQREVVKEERRQSIDNAPYGPSYLAIDEQAYENFAYKHSVIGSMEDLDRSPLDDVKRFFQTYYLPSNAVLMIVGDVKVTQALSLAEKYFSEIPSGPVPEKVNLSEPPQKREKFLKMTDSLAKLPAFHIAFHVPQRRSPDSYPLEIISYLLSQGESSRLFWSLVKEKGVATQVQTWYDERVGPSLFVISVTLRPGADPSVVREECLKELERLALTPPAKEEMEKARNQARMQFLRIETVNQKAVTFGARALYDGDPSTFYLDLEALTKVTGEEVSQTVRRYLTRSNSSTVEVEASSGEKKEERK